MFCKNCGRQIPNDAAFCPSCGTKRSDGDTFADGRSGIDIRNLPSYAKEIDRSGHAVDSDHRKFSLSDPERKKFSLSDSGQDKFSLSDPGRDKFSLSDKTRKGDDGGIVRLTSNREPAAQKKEPATPPREPASPKELTGFVNPLKDSGGTVFRSGNPPDKTTAGSTKDTTVPSTKDMTAGSPASSVRQDQTAPHEAEAGHERKDDATGFVNPLKEAGLDIHLGSDGDRNQPAEDVGEINSPHLKFAVWMVILSCLCCDPLTLILGIIAIVFAFQVTTCSRSGNLGIALQKAAVARVLCWITFGLLAAWISLLVAMLCLPMPEDHTEKKQTEQVEDENAEKPAEQAEGENAEKPAEQTDGEIEENPMEQADGENEVIQAEQADGGNVKSAETDHHHSNLGLLLDILD